jgi:hypothetical protein
LYNQYAVGPAFAWRDDFRRYDRVSSRRSMRPDSQYIAFTPFQQVSDEFKSGKGEGFVYLEFPNVLNDDALAQLKEHDKVKATHTISRSGYSIQAYEFVPKRSSQ